MAQYARCTLKTSFFVGEDESFRQIADEIVALIQQHYKIGTVTFHANVGYEFVTAYDEEGTYDEQEG